MHRHAVHDDDEFILVPRRTRRRHVNLRKLLGVCVLLGMIWGGVWLIAFSGLSAPIITKAQPAVDAAKDMAKDPKGALMMVAAAIASHMGILAFIFDDRNY